MKKYYLALYWLFLSFALAAQSIQSVVPNTGPQGVSGLSIAITGTNVEFNGGSSTYVTLSQGVNTMYGYNVVVANEQHLTADFDIPYSTPVGLYDLYVSSAIGGGTLNNAFTVTQGPPLSITIAPDSACSGQDLAVSISGQNTDFLQGSSTFYIEAPGGPLYPYSTVPNSNVNAVAFFNLTGVAPGNYNIIDNDYIDGILTSTNNLTVLGPQILSVSPDTGLINNTLDVTITGFCSNFQSATNTSVWFNQNAFVLPASSIQATGIGTLVATMTLSSSMPIGYYNVNVSYAADTFYMLNGFYVDTPASLPLTPCNASFVINPTADTGIYSGYNLSTGNDLNYMWNFGDGTSSTSPYPTHNYATPGFYNICLTVYNDSCTSTFCDSSFYAFKTSGAPISELIIMPTAITQIAPPSVSIFPNPATSKLIIQTSNLHASHVVIYDMQGRITLQQKFETELDISTLPAGIYTLEISGTEGKIMKRLVKM